MPYTPPSSTVALLSPVESASSTSPNSNIPSTNPFFTFVTSPASPPNPLSSPLLSSPEMLATSDIVTTASASAKVPVSLRLNLGDQSNLTRSKGVVFPVTDSGEKDAKPCGTKGPTIMIRKKSGELVKPSLKHTTSYPFSASSISAPTSPGPTFVSLDSSSSIASSSSIISSTSTSSFGTIVPTPQTPSKMVHFDAHLEHVKLFSAEQKPAAVSRDGSPGADITTDDTESGGEYFSFRARSSSTGARFLHQPQQGKETEASVAKRVEAQFVNFSSQENPILEPQTNLRLSTLELSTSPPLPATPSQAPQSPGAGNLTLEGQVLVRNLSYAKWIAVRFTLDDWQTVSEVSGRWVRSIRLERKQGDKRESSVSGKGNGLAELEEAGDLFAFSIKLADHLHRIASKTLIMCIRYSIPNSEWWDNNSGQNYVVRFSLRPASVSMPAAAPLHLQIPKVEGLPVPSSPEPEDLKKRLERLRPRRDKSTDRGDDSDDQNDLGAKARSWASSKSREKGSTVPFPSTEKEANTSAWLRSQSQQESQSHAKSINPPQHQRRSHTFPNSFAGGASEMWGAFGPFVSGGGSIQDNGNSRSSAPWTTTSFTLDRFSKAGTGSPRERRESDESAYLRHAHANTQPVHEHNGAEKRKSRNHQRRGYFDSWAAGTAGEAKKEEMAKSGVKFTPPGTPQDAKVHSPLPDIGASPSPSEEEHQQNQDRDDEVEREQTPDSEPEQPISASSSSNETVTLEDHLASLSLDAEAEAEAEPEPETPSLDTTSASSPSEDTELDSDILIMRTSSASSARAASLQSLFGVLKDLPVPVPPVPVDVVTGTEDEKRRYEAFVDQFCFFTGSLADPSTAKSALSPRSPAAGLFSHSSRQSSLENVNLLLSPLHSQVLNMNLGGLVVPPSPRRANSESSVETLRASGRLGGGWPTPRGMGVGISGAV